MKTIKELEQAIIDTENGKGSKYNEILIDWYQRSTMGEEKQLVLPDLQRMRGSQVKKIIKDLKELGIKKFAMMNYGTLNGMPWEFMKALRELGYHLKGTVQVLKKVTEEYPEETYEAFLMKAA